MNKWTENLRMRQRTSVIRSVARVILGVFTGLFAISTPSLAQTSASDQKTISLEELQQMALSTTQRLRRPQRISAPLKGGRNSQGCIQTPRSGILVKKSEVALSVAASKASLSNRMS